VFKSSLAKIPIIVLFLKIILVMDLDDFLFLNFFSLLSGLSPNSRCTPAYPSRHRLKIADVAVHEKSSVVLLIRASEKFGNTLLSCKLFTYLRTYVRTYYLGPIPLQRSSTKIFGTS
jgi:hypothetical protein